MEIKTLKDLKTFLDGLNEDQLNQDALLHIVDSRAERIKAGSITHEDEYLSDEMFEPVSTFEPSDEGDSIENYEIRKAGFVYLYNE